jgi:beta-lactamase class A
VPGLRIESQHHGLSEEGKPNMKTAIAAAALTLISPAALYAQEAAPADQQEMTMLESRTADAVAVLQGARPAQEVFSPAFLGQVSAEQLAALNQQLEAQFGPLQGVESITPTGENGGEIALRFEKAIGRGIIAIEGGGNRMVEGLRLTAFEPVGDDPQTLAQDIAALPGNANALLVRLDPAGTMEPIVSHNADLPLALGSTFKLYVLSALSEAIEAGDLAWDQVVALDQQSYPSGQMQDWPAGSPVTVQTLAIMMISISDNTATDQLIELVGRDQVEAELIAAGNSAPGMSLPFLKTREMFEIKASGEAARAAYLAANADTRRALLDDLGEERIAIEDIERTFSGAPVALGIEWFASPNDLARLFNRMIAREDHTALSILSVNPSLPAAERAKWTYTGYKGGSEPGVLNLTWLLGGQDGEWYLATLGWNDEAAPVDQTTLELLGTRMVALGH